MLSGVRGTIEDIQGMSPVPGGTQAVAEDIQVAVEGRQFEVVEGTRVVAMETRVVAVETRVAAVDSLMVALRSRAVEDTFPEEGMHQHLQI